jgi:predicted CoA-binding protein
MATKQEVSDFLSQKTLAVVGVSRSREKFSNGVYRELKGKGYRVFPINPNAETIDGDPCYPNLGALPEPVGGAVVIVPRTEVEAVVKDVVKAGIPRVWIQQQAETKAAIEYCQANGVKVIYNECVLMFAEPSAWFHKAHKFVWGVAGKLPK